MSQLEGSPIYEEAKSKPRSAAPPHPEAEGVPAEEGIDDADLEERLEDEPDEAVNRRDVPPTPDNTTEERTADEDED